MLVRKWYRHYARWYAVAYVAKDAASANTLMAAQSHLGLLAELEDGQCVLVNVDDKGRELITRQEYMAAYTNSEEGAALHHAYYSQFVNAAVLALVKRNIGTDRIKASADPHFNDIPLREWDALNDSIRGYAGSLLSVANGAGVSLSDTVCVAKAAARIIKERA